MNHSTSLVHDILKRMESYHAATARSAHRDTPGCNFDDALEQDLLITRCEPKSFQLGTGASIFTDCLLPAITSARHEIIFVTCFWAPSKSLTALCDALTKLAAHRRALTQDALSKGSTSLPPLRVRICLSSRSLLQKLLHPQSRDGYVYPPSSWPKKLGLPNAALLDAGGIHLHVKSLFFLPFSVMHPKFVIIDRQRGFVPSCNVSWEPWLEGCVEIVGDAVQSLLAFYSRTWEQTVDFRERFDGVVNDSEGLGFDIRRTSLALVSSTAHHRTTFEFHVDRTLPTLVLPSSYHRNPRFRPFPWQNHPTPPGMPLNVALLQLFERAQRSIYIQTPNLTCEAVIAAVLCALAKGVDVSIVTNRNMMLLEQFATAGTTTSWCVRSLIRRFQRLKLKGPNSDLEAGRCQGRLQISYFQPRSCVGSRGRERQPLMTSPQGEEPVHSHLKLTLVDGEYAMLGSGNLDRASWFTSQELGIMFQGREFCAAVKAGVDEVLEGRLASIFDSDDGERRG